MSRNVPNGLIILLLGGTGLKESVLANVDSSFDFSDLNDWIAHLRVRLVYIPLEFRPVRTFVTQLFIILGTSTPLALAIPDQRSLVMLLPYKCSLR